MCMCFNIIINNGFFFGRIQALFEPVFFRLSETIDRKSAQHTPGLTPIFIPLQKIYSLKYRLIRRSILSIKNHFIYFALLFMFMNTSVNLFAGDDFINNSSSANEQNGNNRPVLENTVEQSINETAVYDVLNHKNTERNKHDEMILVKGGTFSMGSGNGVSHELPVHLVAVRDFYMSRFELTFIEYDSYCKETGKPLPSDKGWGRDLRPAIYINWFDAIEYCNWRSAKEGYTACYSGGNNTIKCDFSCNGYRLPTEAEWEYAARGGRTASTDIYSGSRDVESVAWYKDNSNKKTHEVGRKHSNSFGLYDMSGNVWEWCWDFYASNYYQSSGTDNPTGATTGDLRVLRGGSWYNGSNYERIAARGYSNPYKSDDYFGFRIVRTAY